MAEADPDAIIARVNLFGWSMSGKRSLAEFFFYNLKAGEQCPGLYRHLLLSITGK